MKHAGDEAHLESAASAVLGGQDVLAAGIFSWQKLLGAEMAGSAAGAVGADLLTGSGTAAAVGAAAGGRVAVEATAAANDMTVALLVAVTDDAIHVLDWDGESAGDEVRLFDRATTDVHVSRFGLSRVVKLHDTTTGDEFDLHGTAAPYLAQAKADKVVMHLIAGT